MEDKSIINWELHQMLMEKGKTIKVCTGIGLDQITPEYTKIYLSDINKEIKENTIIKDWLEKYGDPKIEKKVKKYLGKINKEIKK